MPINTSVTVAGIARAILSAHVEPYVVDIDDPSGGRVFTRRA